MKNKWVKIKAGARWRYMNGSRILGVVTWAFDGWDAFVLTQRKWPNGVRQLNTTRRFWDARRSVEEEVSNGK
jgi:hypothetical protein